MSPAYDYLCERCKADFEGHAPIASRDKVDCPRCGTRAKRVWRKAPGIKFEGFGWTRNESGWSSMKKEQARSNREIGAYMDEQKAKAWDKALNSARDWSDQDHADYEAGIRTLESRDGHPRAPAPA